MRLKTIGGLIADGVDPADIPEETWQELPLNRADLRRYYRKMPRHLRRQVFGRWRRRRYCYSDWIEQQQGVRP